MRLLTHAEVSYSDPRSFNDPLDCDPTIEVDLDRSAMEHLCYAMLLRVHSEDQARAEINNYRYLSSEYGDFRTEPGVEDYLKRILAQRIKDELEQEFGLRGVLSLSERWNSVLMWSHYADQHRGVCIEFDTSEIEHPTLKPIDYRAPRRIRASDLLKWKHEQSAAAEQLIFDTYFFAKAGAWRYEREWREVVLERGVSESGFRVTAIYFGLQCDPAIVLSVVKLLASDPDVKLYSIFSMDGSFRLSRRLIDRQQIECYGLKIPAAIEFKDVFLNEIAVANTPE
ncbi:MAG: DUF2971 domain-containing protein [Alphaproteobacteria bacterium]|nr:DUF2971 domain-containing protein [Alphaproteobacteria bacterium]